MTLTNQTASPGWERINDIRREIFSIPIRQLPEAPRLRVAAMLNGLAFYTTALEDELRKRSHEPPRNSGEGTAVDGPMPLAGGDESQTHEHE